MDEGRYTEVAEAQSHGCFLRIVNDTLYLPLVDVLAKVQCVFSATIMLMLIIGSVDFATNNHCADSFLHPAQGVVITMLEKDSSIVLEKLFQPYWLRAFLLDHTSDSATL